MSSAQNVCPKALSVRKAEKRDLPRLMELFRQAREIMRADGNQTQWAGEYPSKDIVLEDISRDHCFVIEEPDNAIVGVFAFIPGVEPTYDKIYENEFTEGGPTPRLAAWLDDTLPYATIHRLASTRDSHGVAEACFSWAWQQCQNLRVDTHADNHIMQHCIQKAGFTYCGIIYLADGSPRLAYQKLQ